MTRTRDRRVSQRAVDGQRGASTSNRVPLSSAAHHMGLSAAVSAPRAPSAPLAGRPFFLGMGGARPVSAVERCANGSPPARAMRRFSSARLRASARLTFGYPPNPSSRRRPWMTMRCTHDFEISCFFSDRTTRRSNPCSSLYLPGEVTVRTKAALSCLGMTMPPYLPHTAEETGRRSLGRPETRDSGMSSFWRNYQWRAKRPDTGEDVRMSDPGPPAPGMPCHPCGRLQRCD